MGSKDSNLNFKLLSSLIILNIEAELTIICQNGGVLGGNGGGLFRNQ
jgi:hypothetical protein